MLPIRKITFLAAGFVVVLGTASYFSPYLTIYQMRQALVKKDARSLSDRIDYPALKSSLKATIQAQVLQQAGSQSQENPFGAMGMAMASQSATSMIDSMVSPEALEAILKLNQNSSQAKEMQQELDKAMADVQMNYESFNSFVVSSTMQSTTKPQIRDKVDLVFHRDGLSWKLAGVRLPSL